VEEPKQGVDDSVMIDNQADYERIFRPKGRLTRSPNHQGASSSGFAMPTATETNTGSPVEAKQKPFASVSPPQPPPPTAKVLSIVIWHCSRVEYCAFVAGRRFTTIDSLVQCSCSRTGNHPVSNFALFLDRQRHVYLAVEQRTNLYQSFQRISNRQQHSTTTHTKFGSIEQSFTKQYATGDISSHCYIPRSIIGMFSSAIRSGKIDQVRVDRHGNRRLPLSFRLDVIGILNCASQFYLPYATC
jgi:hypothetical protein